MVSRRLKRSEALDLGIKSAVMSYFIFIGKFASLVMGALMLVIIARIIGPTNYGIYTLAIATAGLVGAFGSLNVGAYFNKEIPRLRAQGKSKAIGLLIGDSLVFLCLVLVVLMTVGGLLAGFLSNYVFGARGYESYIYVALLSIIGGVLLPILNAVLVSLGRGAETAISFLSGTLFQAIISITLVLFGYGAMGALIGYAAGFAFGSIISLYYIGRRTKMRLAIEGYYGKISRMLIFSVPVTGVSIITTLVSNFSVIILGLMLIPIPIIGEYGLATRFGWVIDIVAGSIASVLVPLFATAIHNKNTRRKLGKLYQGTLFYGLMFTMPIIVYATVLSKAIILTVFTNAYVDTIAYLPLISIGILIGLFASYAFSLVISLGNVRHALKYSVIAGLVQFVAMVLIVYLLRYLGAGYFYQVIGVIVGYLFLGNVVLGLLYLRELHSMGIFIDSRPLIRVIISCIILGILLLPLLFIQVRYLYGVDIYIRPLSSRRITNHIG